MTDYDVIVLGGGSAGSAAARAASLAGARSAMINEGELGGLCILRGCMPTKTLLATAHAVHEARNLEPLGARLRGDVEIDFQRVMQRKSDLVERFKRAKVRSIEASNYEVIPGRARFAPGGGVEVDGRKLTARGYVVATGSVPIVLPIPGIEKVPVLTSDDVMRMRRQPRALLVQGAGPIGLELAQFFARIGTRVLLVNRSSLCYRFDTEAGEELARALEAETNLDLVVRGRIEEVHPDVDGLVARIASAETTREFRADALLMAAGRRAALDDIGLENAGLESRNDRLEHDAGMRTSNPAVWVAGDSTGEQQILHIANQEGAVAGYNAAGGVPTRETDDRLLMQVVFTDPPFVQIGLSEADAERAGRAVVVGRVRFPETGRAITMGTEYGLWKLVADRESGEILGSTILGPRADDLVHTIAVLMHHHAAVSEILALPWYHPTLSEVMIDLARDVVDQMESHATW
jgi:pyruvate/2-oxoglutarate dehydrogenase complex dihydrolipoamide dehydrogenase (E3) component